MKIRIASLLLALALPLTAQQESAPADAENMFYKAFYLEKGQRDFAGAMALYEQFLTKAPEHKLAAEAAKQQYRLLDATGKTKERDAFKAKHEKLLGAVATAPAPAPASQERPAGGAAGERPARGQGGAAGQGGRARGGLMGAIMGGKPVAEMSDEEITQLKTGLDQSSGMIDMMRERNPEQADKLEKGVADLKAALDKGDKAAAQTALDALKGAMPQRGGRGNRGGGGGEAGGAGGRGGNAGGGGGQAGGNAGGGGGGGGN